MKSPFPSILPVEPPTDLQGEDSGANSTANELTNSSGESASYSARYQAFLSQQTQRKERASGQGGLNVLAGLVQGLINLAIFVVLFLGFLTLFGFGLSRLNGNFNVSQSNVSAAGKQDSDSAVKLSQTPAAPKKKANNK